MITSLYSFPHENIRTDSKQMITITIINAQGTFLSKWNLSAKYRPKCHIFILKNTFSKLSGYV